MKNKDRIPSNKRIEKINICKKKEQERNLRERLNELTEKILEHTTTNDEEFNELIDEWNNINYKLQNNSKTEWVKNCQVIEPIHLPLRNKHSQIL